VACEKRLRYLRQGFEEVYNLAKEHLRDTIVHWLMDAQLTQQQLGQFMNTVSPPDVFFFSPLPYTVGDDICLAYASLADASEVVPEEYRDQASVS
jgi:hypothetical protein